MKSKQEAREAGVDRPGQRLQRMHHNFERYESSLPRGNVIRYKDICETNGRALSIIVPAAAGLDEPLESKNGNPPYDCEKMLRMGERLPESEGAYWNFYTARACRRSWTSPLVGFVGPLLSLSGPERATRGGRNPC